MNNETFKQEYFNSGLNNLKQSRNTNQTGPGKNENQYFNAFTTANGERIYKIKSDDEWGNDFKYYSGRDRRGGKRKSRNRKRRRGTRRR